MNPPNLPTYGNPPLIEVVSGVMFDPLPGFKMPLVGKFWSEALSEFKTVEEQPPLAPSIELLGRGPGLLFLSEPFPLPRVWFANERGDQIIQIQRDRFLCNWRKIDAEHEYPRFTRVKDFFDVKLASFEKFVTEQCGQPPVARQYELTYVNHVVLNSNGLNQIQEIARVLPDLSWRFGEARWLPVPEAMDTNLAFLLPNGNGRLRVKMQNGQRMHDQASVLVLELTARGFGEDRDQWFSLAHTWIVKAFEDLASPGMNEHWKKQ